MKPKRAVVMLGNARTELTITSSLPGSISAEVSAWQVVPEAMTQLSTATPSSRGRRCEEIPRRGGGQFHVEVGSGDGNPGRE